MSTIARMAARILALASVALFAPCTRAFGATPAEGVFARAAELLAAGQPRAALDLADAATDPLERAQARVYVLHHGGDPSGALSAGLAGLRVAPGDLWLLERSAALALDLGAAALAHELVERFDAQLTDDAQAQDWADRRTQLHTRLDQALARRERSERSLLRARITVISAALLALLGLAAATRGA